jgi:hypothetical protein
MHPASGEYGHEDKRRQSQRRPILMDDRKNPVNHASRVHDQKIKVGDERGYYRDNSVPERRPTRSQRFRLSLENFQLPEYNIVPQRSVKTDHRLSR